MQKSSFVKNVQVIYWMHEYYNVMITNNSRLDCVWPANWAIMFEWKSVELKQNEQRAAVQMHDRGQMQSIF